MESATSGPPGNRFRAKFTKAKLVGWVRVIVWNTFQMSMDIRLKLRDWDRLLGIWTIWTPGS